MQFRGIDHWIRCIERNEKLQTEYENRCMTPSHRGLGHQLNLGAMLNGGVSVRRFGQASETQEWNTPTGTYRRAGRRRTDAAGDGICRGGSRGTALVLVTALALAGTERVDYSGETHTPQ